MRFIVDAQLPRRLARWLAARGHDVLHTLDLPNGNSTPDAAIVELACRENRIVVTKDADFVNSHLLTVITIKPPQTMRPSADTALQDLIPVPCKPERDGVTALMRTPPVF